MRRFAAAIGAVLLCGAIGASAAAADLPGPWVELGSDGTLSVRALVAAGAACPAVSADGKPAVTQTRGAADAIFPVSACEARVPLSTTALTVGGVAAPILSAQVKRIVVIGDSGCRLEGHAIQDCNEPNAWPFPAIAERAAARHPDVVIHVGDYYYREASCPPNHAGCAGSPHGDNWAAWKADFFDPGTPLTKVAPWVMVRGNHELCRRGGRGWVRLLDPLPFAADCANHSEPYRLSAGGLDLLMFDSADSDDFFVRPEKVAAYGEQLGRLLRDAPPHSWLVTHRPVWSPAGGQLDPLAINVTEQQAIHGRIPATVDLVLSGHLHDFAAYSFGAQRPAQLIVGTAGDALHTLGKAPLAGREIDGMPIAKGFAVQRFGYFVFDRAAEGWDGVFYAPDDSVLARCSLRGRDLDCR